jgi:DNA-binding IclR family transcriptional regulator
MKRSVDQSDLITRTVAILRIFAEGGRVISIKEIADELALPPSSVHRVLDRLVKLQVVQRAPNRRYRVGVEYFRLGTLVNRKLGILERAKPIMVEMAEQSQETCQVVLYQPNYRQMTVAARIEPPNALHNGVRMYRRMPLAWGAIGRAMLAWLDEDMVDEALRISTPSPVTHAPAPKANRIRSQLSEIRESGYASASGELFSHEAVGIAAPFFDADDDIAGCLCVVAPKDRCGSAQTSALASDLISHSRRLSRILGSTPGDGAGEYAR